MKKVFLLVCSLLLVGFSFGQHKRGNKWIWGPSIGWQYQSGNFLKASGWGLFAPNDRQYVKIDAGANFTWMRQQTTVIPELGLTYYLSNRLVFPFLKAEVTPYTVTPKLGIGLLSIIDLGIGYGFAMQTKDNFKPIKGINGSVSLNIPLNFHLY
ncbi:hypothetical protein [Sphingobacterium griseoflavum]|uniref:Outer membrane protein beta-barrel domain-containing protein n=1 Tax=Sphingobacterium griseoflavum TaxID=1474952 RepID=A0ABQ3HSQ6_9SPHI|nr:hypothetical protein [Sphingobacterium griseoflavum]GHE29950.1 hypothetical protein GCM10017764_11270 [Sphingobacterium griseoflavum]